LKEIYFIFLSSSSSLKSSFRIDLTNSRFTLHSLEFYNFRTISMDLKRLGKSKMLLFTLGLLWLGANQLGWWTSCETGGKGSLDAGARVAARRPIQRPAGGEVSGERRLELNDDCGTRLEVETGSGLTERGPSMLAWSGQRRTMALGRMRHRGSRLRGQRSTCR
jgi:hypothetical protein